MRKKGIVLVLTGLLIVSLLVFKLYFKEQSAADIHQHISEAVILTTSGWEKPLPVFASKELLIYHESGRIAAKSPDGNVKWDIPVAVNSKCFFTKNILVIHGNVIKCFDPENGKEVYTRIFEGEITHCMPASKDHVIIEYVKETTRYVVVLSYNGKPVYSLKQGKDYFLTGDILENSGVYLLSNLSLRENKIKGMLILYNKQNQPLWSRTIDNGVFGWVSSISGEKFAAIEGSKLVLINKSGETKEIDTRGHILRALAFPDSLAVARLTTPQSGILEHDETVLELYDNKGNKAWSYLIPGFIKGMVQGDENNVIVYTDHRVYVISIKKGKIIGVYSSKAKIEKLVPSHNTFPIYIKSGSRVIVAKKR